MAREDGDDAGGAGDGRAGDAYPFNRQHLALGIGSKLALNTSMRHVFPFAPFLSDELGVSVGRFFFATALADLTGLSALFIGPVVDSHGTFRVFAAGTLFASAALALCAVFREYYVFLACWPLFGLGFNCTIASLQTTVGATVNPERMGRTTGFIETSWAGSALVGFPLVGVLLQESGWHASFVFLLCGVALTSGALLYTFPGRSEGNATVLGTRKLSARPATLDVLRQVARRREAWGALLLCLATAVGQAVFFANYGTWLVDEYGLDAESVGYTTFLIGSAELMGSVGTSFVGQRIGLWRSVAIGAGLEAVAQAVLVVLGAVGSPRLGVSLAALFFAFLTMEFLIVSLISFFTVFAAPTPALRAHVMALLYGAFALGRTAGSLLAEPVYGTEGITSVALVALFAHLLGMLIFVTATAGAEPTPDPATSSAATIGGAGAGKGASRSVSGAGSRSGSDAGEPEVPSPTEA